MTWLHVTIAAPTPCSQGSATLNHHPARADYSCETIMLLAALAVFNAFDLAFTQAQLLRGNFAEANRLAALMAQCGPLAVSLYKFALFAFGAALLYRLRHRWECRVGLWLLTLCYAGLMVWWLAYIDAVEICFYDPAVTRCVAPY